MASICGEDNSYSTTYMKRRMLEHYGNSIIITELNGKSNVVTFRSRAHAILHNYYHRQNKNDSESEKLAIIKTAGKLILNDIKDMEENAEIYPSANDMSTEGNRKYVPPSLVTLLQQLIDQKDPERIIIAISQAIVQAAIPRSIICPLQLGLGVQLHHQFGSRILIETLNSLGFCSSYQEVQKYEKCAAYTQGNAVDRNNVEQYVQFVADNIDHNTATIDGHNTFHGMGIIATFTPKDNKRRVVPRIQVTNEELVKIGKINIKYYKQNDNVLENVKFEKLLDIDCEDPIPGNFEFLVKITRPLRPMTPSWSGIMQTVQKGEHPGESKVHFLPMIDMNPSDMSCIYSTLTYVAQQARLMNIDPVITFDQPLFWKAMTIITNKPDSSELKRAVIRLGAFHMEMSFLGCIGKIMENSGLSELLSTVYAPNTVCHMLSGKAVQRAIRGHFLASDALDQLIMEKTFPELMETQYTDENNNHAETGRSNDEVYSPEQRKLVTIFESVLEQKIDQRLLVTEDNVNLKEMVDKVESTKHTLKSSRTAKLWLQYLEMINLLKQFIAAERIGNWRCHLKSLKNMFPFFAAAGHNLYTKSSYMYLQQMNCLHITHPEVCQAFEKGLHVVRRSNRMWGGLSTDLVIEQVLMRSV
ncbi:uncharacterized protein LOC128558588 [Mercenaria mercenaria]|uniref:uncharacterized protein LOC128558588 n=1 Tax=Mercenaria mercenaria TaxID=6596 RepID=UPI00234F262E|nr:uncharacterized protein LOC128558588 [Mercenaria mercenaria]